MFLQSHIYLTYNFFWERMQTCLFSSTCLKRIKTVLITNILCSCLAFEFVLFETFYGLNLDFGLEDVFMKHERFDCNLCSYYVAQESCHFDCRVCVERCRLVCIIIAWSRHMSTAMIQTSLRIQTLWSTFMCAYNR